MANCTLSRLALTIGLTATLALGSTSLAFAQSKGFLGARAAAEKAIEPKAVASAAELTDTGETATLNLTLSGPVEASAFVLADPDRVIVELPAVAYQLDPESGRRAKPQGKHRAPEPNRLIDSFRFGSFAPGRSRVVIDLHAPVRVLRTEITKISDDGRVRLSIQLVKTDRAAFHAAATAARAKMAAAAPIGTPAASPAVAAPMALPRIVIDPGHGGVDSGAMVNGLIEKTVVLDFAKALTAKLNATGRYTVVMTRDDDTFISLGDRVKLARDDNAALFVSVHADTLNEADVTGATVYTVSEHASDVQAARVAEKENQSDAAAGVDGKEEAVGVSDILFDLTRRETRAYSHVFAHTLANYWRVAGRLNKNPERSAGFKVLTAPDVPSVLLELGYLSNDKDAAALNSPDWRDKATAQVADAIDHFFTARNTAVATEPPPEPAHEAALKTAPLPDLNDIRPAIPTHVAGATH